MTLPFFKKVYQLKNKITRDLPDIPQLVNTEMLVVKDDFYRLVTRQLNKKTTQVDVDIRLVMYYNTFALAFGYDTLEIYLDINDKKKHIKYINLYEKMSPKEQRVIDYISGILKYMSELDELIGSEKSIYRDSARERLSYQDLFTTDEEARKFTGLNVQTIPMKFPEIKVVDGTAYLYSNSYFERVDKPGRSTPILKIPFTNSFREVSKIANATGAHEQSNVTEFQESCYRLVAKNIDPLQVFMRANFVKSSESRVSINNLTYEEKKLVSDFLNAIGSTPPLLVRNDGTTKSVDSDVRLATGLTNLKKISTVLFFEGFDKELLKSIRISLTKRNKDHDVVQVIDPSSKFLEQSIICDLERTSDLGCYPVNFSRSKMNPSDESSLTKDIAIERDQMLDGEIGVYTENRIVSRNTSLNGGFAVTNLKRSERLISTVNMSVIGDTLLKRDIILNYRTGEFLVNSTITPNKILGHYNRSKIEQLVANIKLFVATIPRGSGDYRGFPKNVIKIIGKDPSLRIARVVCKPAGSASPFLLPVLDQDTKEIQHIDPVAGVKYRYEIYFVDEVGILSLSPIIAIHRTFPRATPGIELVLSQRTKDLIRIDVVEDSDLSISKNIRYTLEKIFSDSPSAAAFYDDFFKERINENLQDIGKLFQLYVQSYNKSTSNLSTRIIESEKDDAGINYFQVPISGNARDNIITYHLIVTNPLELVSSGFETIEDPSTREKFTRRTAAFFNTFTLVQGQLPAEFIDKKTGAKFYANNSRINPLDPFSKISCVGGIVESNLEPPPRFHNITGLNHIYNPDDGECVITWYCRRSMKHVDVRNSHIDFFIVTADINGVEFPVTACPFIGFTTYRVRTYSFLGAASQVKFRVYSVYNDFHIQSNGKINTAHITDVRKVTQEL